MTSMASYGIRGPGRKHGASLYTRKRFSLASFDVASNYWQSLSCGESKKIGMTPLPSNHAGMAVDRRVEQGGDWWLADDVEVPAEANVLDFVFSDGGGKFDNNKAGPGRCCSVLASSSNTF